jgi:hypothetical protein
MDSSYLLISNYGLKKCFLPVKFNSIHLIFTGVSFPDITIITDEVKKT